jgi:hypothetical protein
MRKSRYGFSNVDDRYTGRCKGIGEKDEEEERGGLVNMGRGI